MTTVKAFRIGYIVTFSFLLILAVVTGTFGFYQAPTGAKSPESPAYPTYNYSNQVEYAKQQSDYAAAQQKYQEKLKAFQVSQKNFISDKIIPYTRNVFVMWIAAVVVFELIGLLFIKMSSSMVGSGFAFTGFLAVVLGPVGGLLWYASSIVSTFSHNADQEFSSLPIYQAICVTALIGVVVLAAIGYFLELRNKPLFI